MDTQFKWFLSSSSLILLVSLSLRSHFSLCQIGIFLLTEILPILFSLKEKNLHALAENPPVPVTALVNTNQPSTITPRPNQNVQVFNVHDMNSRYSFSGSEDISGMVWLENNAGGGALYNSTSQQSDHQLQSITSPTQISRGRVSLSDPYPPPPTSPNFHTWNRKSYPASNHLSNDLASPRSSVTSEHSPRVAGGWFWWLGI